MLLDSLITSGTVRPIVRWGTPVLHRPSRPVTDFGPELWSLIADMFATNTAAPGAGLAAPQVGVDLAVFVFDCDDAEGVRYRGVMCNPTVTLPDTREPVTALEGCLSLPGARVPVTRSGFATCTGFDHAGNPLTISGTGTFGRCLQHETDHLNGIVMEDHLTEDERQILHAMHDDVAADFPAYWPASEEDALR